MIPPPSWYTVKPPSRDWLLRDLRRSETPGVLPLAEVGAIVAEGGAGKTMAQFQLAYAVATGGTWLGSFSAQQGRVLVLVGEEKSDEAQRRLYRAARAAGGGSPAPDSIVLLPLRGIPVPMVEADERRNLVDAPFLVWLRAYVAAQRFALVILDPLTRFAGKDAEIDNAAGTRFVQALESVSESSSGASVLAAHHTAKITRGKGAVRGSSGRGSSSLSDGGRWECTLGVEELEHEAEEHRERLGEIVVLSFTKSNYGRKAAPLLLRRDSEYGGALVPLDALDAELVRAAREGNDEEKKREKSERKREEQSEADRADAKAIAEFVLANPGATIGKARACAVRDNSGRWERATVLLRGVLFANGRPYAEHAPGKKGALTIDREAFERW